MAGVQVKDKQISASLSVFLFERCYCCGQLFVQIRKLFWLGLPWCDAVQSRATFYHVLVSQQQLIVSILCIGKSKKFGRSAVATRI